jgi:predicted Zn finger-like uncharacterized protein
MKFSCERCQTRYSIGDEKVRGKVLKIRCKTCGNIVVVREQTATSQAAMPELIAASGAGSTTTSPAPMQSQPMRQQAPGFPPQNQQRPVLDIDWYVAIKGKQHGPAKKDEIVRLFREGKITDRSYLWNEGMAAWTRLREVPQFASLLTGDTVPRRPPPPPPPSEEQGGERQGAEIIPFQEAKRAREQQPDPFAAVTAQRSNVGPVTNDPFAAVGVSNPGGDNAPRDSTRVFIMQAGLHNRGQKHRAYAYGAAAFVLVLSAALFADYQEIIAIPGLHSVVNVVTQREEKKEPVAEVANAAWDTAEEDPALKCKLMPNPGDCVKQTMALNDLRRARKKAKAAEKDPSLDPSNFNTSGPGGDPNLRAAVGTGVGGAADISDQSEAARIKAVFAKDKEGGKKLTVPKPRIEPVAVSGSDIDAESVFKTIAQNNESIRSCVEEGAKVGNVPQGRQVLIIGIEPNGKVSKASFRDGPTSASPVGECIRGAAKRWKFQAFPGPAADVEVPLILSVGM